MLKLSAYSSENRKLIFCCYLEKLYIQTSQFTREKSEIEFKIRAYDENIYPKFVKDDCVDLEIKHTKHPTIPSDVFNISKLRLNHCQHDSHFLSLAYYQYDRYCHLGDIRANENTALFFPYMEFYRRSVGEQYAVEDSFIVDGGMPNLYGATDLSVFIRNTFFNIDARIHCENIRPEPHGFAFFNNYIDGFTYEQYREERGLSSMCAEVPLLKWCAKEGF